MKVLVLAISLFVGSTSSEDAASANQLDKLYAEVVSHYGLETEDISFDLDTPQSVEVYDQSGNLLLKSENIEQDLRLIDTNLVAIYRQAEFVIETSETKIYMLN